MTGGSSEGRLKSWLRDTTHYLEATIEHDESLLGRANEGSSVKSSV